MWETGYAMALGKPLIILTQDLATLPFDVKDMQALSYDRGQLTRTLGSPLRDIIHDTISNSDKGYMAPNSTVEDQSRLMIGLGIQLAELKDMIGKIVATWDQGPSKIAFAPSSRMTCLEGSWLNKDNDTNIYIQNIGGVIVAPYCYGGNNRLTAYYYDWRELDEYVFARFKWLSGSIKGFTFLKLKGNNLLQGAYWHEDDVNHVPNTPPLTSGNRITWFRSRRKPPLWAVAFFEQVMRGEVSEFIVDNLQQNTFQSTRFKE